MSTESLIRDHFMTGLNGHEIAHRLALAPGTVANYLKTLRTDEAAVRSHAFARAVTPPSTTNQEAAKRYVEEHAKKAAIRRGYRAQKAQTKADRLRERSEKRKRVRWRRQSKLTSLDRA